MNESETKSSIPCNLCGCDDATELYAAGVAQLSRIVRCNHCGLIYANPRGKQPDIETIESWDPHFDMTKAPHYHLRRDKESFQVRDYRNTRRELAQRFPQRGKLLEIGASLGFGLAEWEKDGWDVIGVEPQVAAAKHAQLECGLDVRPVTLSEAEFPDESFDVVVMLHVIEHLPDPKTELKRIHRVLKPGGRFVCETPRYDTLTFKLLGHRERSISCDGHIYFFTLDTLSRLGRSVGFEVERVRIVGRSLTLERLAYNLGVISKSPKLLQSIRRSARKLGLHKVPLYLNLRDMQRITFYKP